MAKPDWGELQQQFLAEHAHSGVSPKEWCEAQGLNYATAKRYIKIANSQKKGANKTANSQSKPVGSKGSAGADKAKGESNSEDQIGDDAADPRTPEDCTPSKTKHKGNPRPVCSAGPGNTRALKHGGYSRRRLLPDDVIEDAEALTLEDELIRIKAASLTADCIPPLPGQPMTYGASVLWNDQLLEVIENCNRDKADIREIEAGRGK